MRVVSSLAPTGPVLTQQNNEAPLRITQHHGPPAASCKVPVNIPLIITRQKRAILQYSKYFVVIDDRQSSLVFSRNTGNSAYWLSKAAGVIPNCSDSHSIKRTKTLLPNGWRDKIVLYLRMRSHQFFNLLRNS
jgi:hypothetical protein